MDILVHSVRQVFGNLSAALRISGALYLVQIVISIGFGMTLLGEESAIQTELPADFLGKMVIILLVSVICGLWIAVSWHRYVLTNEQPGAVLPAFRGDRMLAYFGYSLLLGLIMMPVLLVMGLIASLVLLPLMPADGVPSVGGLIALGVIVYVPTILVFYRLSVILPAAALEEPLGIKAAWAKTRGADGPLLVLAILSVAAGLILSLPSQFVFTPGSIPGLVWDLAVQWVLMMVGVSILTTLYGHYVEGRVLVGGG